MRSIRQSIRRSLSSITTQITLSQIATVTITLLLVGGLLIYLSFYAQLNQLQVTQQLYAETVSVKIGAYIDDLHDELTYLSRIRGLTTLDPVIQHDLLDALSRHNSAYDIIGMTDRKGNLQQGVSQFGDKIPTLWQDTAPFRRAFQEQEDYIGPVEQGIQNQWPSLIIAMPIRDAQNQVDGVLFARITLRFLWAVLDETVSNQHGYVYMVDNRQFVIAQSGTLPDHLPFKDLSQEPIGSILNRDRDRSTAFSSYRGLNQVDVLGNIARVATTNWLVVVEIPVTEAYSPANTLLGTMMIGVLAGLLFAVGIGTGLSHRIISPLQRLTQVAAQMSSGDLDIVLRMDQALELSLLATAFNKMAAQLKDTIQRLQEDIAERKQAETQLRERQRFIERILELIPDIIYIYDLDEARNVFASHQVAHVLGYSEEEIQRMGSMLMDHILSDEDKRLLPERLVRLQAATDQDIVIHEQPFLTAAGNLRWFQVREVIFSRAPDGHAKEVLGAMVEITERRQAEQVLRELNMTLEQRIEDRLAALHHQQIQFSTLVYAMGEGMFHVENHRIQYVNKALCVIFGYSMTELIGQPPEVLIPIWQQIGAERFEDEQQLEGEQVSPSVVLRGETEVLRKDRTAFMLGYSISQIVESEKDGKSTSIVAVVRDVSDSKALEQNLQNALEHEKELSQLKSRFVSIVSHEFRTPLASIQLTTDLLKLYADRLTEVQKRERLEKIQGDIRRMTHMLEDILTFSRVEAGRLALKSEAVDPIEFCESCLKNIEALVGTHHFEFNVSGKPQPYDLDRELLDHVLMNLLNNSVKYSKAGTTIYLTLKCSPDAVAFSVRDEGIGIPPEDQVHLFEPFHRASNVGQISGTGLGLTIVKELVELHKGTVALQSISGKGSTFTVTIPCDIGQ